MTRPSRRRFLRDAGFGAAGIAVGAGSATLLRDDEPEPEPRPSEPPQPVADTYLIQDYGASEDDAWRGISSAIAAAAANGGGVVHIPPGEWVVRDSVVLRSNVTLRGATMLGSVLKRAPGGAGDTADVVAHEVDVTGATVENLTLDGGFVPDGETSGRGLAYPQGAGYCVVRRLLVKNVAHSGVVLESGSFSCVFLQDVYVEGVGGHGLAVGTSTDSVFVTGLSVRGFGSLAAGSRGVVTSGRCHLNQVHIEPVAAGRVGVEFLPGSESSTLSNYFIQLDGGEAFADVERAELGSGSVR
jgi:hypothetical protein